MSPAALRIAAAPPAAALAVLALVFLTGFDQHAALPPLLGRHFYGFFLDRYPLFAFAIPYGIARILAAACEPGPASILRRGTGGLVALGLLLALSLYPTFGGLVLRAGFMPGGVAFLNGIPLNLAYLLGAAMAAVVFLIPTELGATLAAGRWPARGRRLRAFGARILGLVLLFLALWFAAAVIGLARDLGFGPWPRRPLDGRDAALATGLILLACLPHTLLVARRHL
ncbi:hypothetical protein [Methylobacterium organophilum]|uniref:hypothetical protein n=1 Tax=Methylobacterium organophilum TaxID=410 RepID=UPI001EE16887|nr:hypothetical protein [Methylobacterium organophilum]